MTSKIKKDEKTPKKALFTQKSKCPFNGNQMRFAPGVSINFRGFRNYDLKCKMGLHPDGMGITRFSKMKKLKTGILAQNPSAHPA